MHLLNIFYISLLPTIIISNENSPVIQQMIDNDLLYNSEGYMYIMQRDENGAKSNPMNIFFKEKLTKCYDDERDVGMFFDMLVCIPTDGDCVKGLSFCYESELLKNKVKDDFIMKKQKDIDCDEPNLHGFRITVADNIVKIHSSMDKNVYTFNLPYAGVMTSDFNEFTEKSRCFKIKIGTKQSIATTITDGEDKPLEISPPLKKIPTIFPYKWTNDDNNFHLLALDFIPKRNHWLINYGDYYKQYFFQGSTAKCNLTIRIEGDKLHRCYADWVPTGLTCPGPYINKASVCRKNYTNLEQCSAAGVRCTTCNFITSWITGEKRTHISRDITTTGSSEGNENYNKEQGVAYIKKIETKKMCGEDVTNKVENAFNLLKEKKVSTQNEVKMFVPEGCISVQKELYMICNGWRFKTGEFDEIFEPNYLSKDKI